MIENVVFFPVIWWGGWEHNLLWKGDQILGNYSLWYTSLPFSFQFKISSAFTHFFHPVYSRGRDTQPPYQGPAPSLALGSQVLLITSPPASPMHPSLWVISCFTQIHISVGGHSEALRPWQRSWGRRLDIRKGGIEPQESPWKFSSFYPHNQSLPALLLCAPTYTSNFTGGCPPPPLSEKELT